MVAFEELAYGFGGATDGVGFPGGGLVASFE